MCVWQALEKICTELKQERDAHAARVAHLTQLNRRVEQQQSGRVTALRARAASERACSLGRACSLARA